MTTQETIFRSVFLSYATSDKASAIYIADALKRAGIRLSFDELELSSGDSILTRIDEAMKSSDYLLLLLSPAFVNSYWVQHEVDLALPTQLRQRAISLIPILLSDCDIPDVLKDRSLIDLRQDRDLGIHQLVSQLSSVPSIDFAEFTPMRFEKLVGDLLVQIGFSVEQQSRAADAGIDFRATYKTEDPFGVPEKETWFVEAKLYRSSRVSINVLREAAGRLLMESEAKKFLIVTNGNITSEARQFMAQSRLGGRIRVIEGQELTYLIARHPSLVQRHFGSGGTRA
jgi:hypothetical protein